MLFHSVFRAAALLLLPALTAAAPSGGSRLSKRCDFDSANAPECWGDFDINTNYYDSGPDTGRIREYWFNIVNTTLSPDGVPRMVLTVNGTIPGPTIIADWGDTVVVHVTNMLQNNGTSIHFHGIRQNHTMDQDGVASITQCPAAPTKTITYRWKATQYGTSWWHSHFALQAWNGVFGGILIRGPATAPYDVDLGTMTLGDWHHRTADELYAIASSGGPPMANNGLINGTNTYNDGGSRYTTTFEAGKRYRIRLINTSIDSMFRFMIDNHTLTVIANDLVPIKPYQTNTVNVGIGQRYDVIVEANASPNNYWLRAIPQVACSANENSLDIRGIVRYDASSTAQPDSALWDYVDSCDDEPRNSTVPHLELDAGGSSQTDNFQLGLKVINGWFKWTLNGNTFISQWGYPTAKQVVEGNNTFAPEQQIVKLDGTDEWVYFVIQNTGLTHPIHLHGHDYWVLAQAKGNYDASAPLQLANPPRRDVAMLPANGYLVIAFKTDNPGIWLMHCHIGWHTSQGFALQIIERQPEIIPTIDQPRLNQTCTDWNTYATSANVVQDDSGV